MAFDRHMNLVLGDAEEFRKLPPKKGSADDEVDKLWFPEDSFALWGQRPPGGGGHFEVQ